MGQWLSLPLIIGGAWLMWTAKNRRTRAEPAIGSASAS
jgi:phosphatidylglycerol:prolipoprotein diacylglycerol transferase